MQDHLQATADRWVLINYIIENTGYTDDAVRAKKQKGVWTAKAHWKNAPDGRLAFNFTRIQEWLCSHVRPDLRPGHWVLMEYVIQNTGYTRDAIQAKIRRGVWKFDLHWQKAPDGRRIFNFTRIQAWMSGENAW